jgi:hypothetical protein
MRLEDDRWKAMRFERAECLPASVYFLPSAWNGWFLPNGIQAIFTINSTVFIVKSLSSASEVFIW